MTLSADEAAEVFLRLVKERDHGGYSKYDFDIYLPTLILHFLAQKDPANHARPNENHPDVRSLLSTMYPVAWEYCRRGILRPGSKTNDGQKSGGVLDGLCVTPFGEEWLARTDRNDFLPSEPGRFGKMLTPHAAKFGPVFNQRAQEAMRCYGAQANLACCVMCGGAAETILLQIASAKIGPEETEREYRGAAGRSRVENRIFGQSKLKQDAIPFLSLLNYWRTDGSHGKATAITENEAYTSLALLLRFAIFVTDSWDELIAAR